MLGHSLWNAPQTADYPDMKQAVFGMALILAYFVLPGCTGIG